VEGLDEAVQLAIDARAMEALINTMPEELRPQLRVFYQESPDALIRAFVRVADMNKVEDDCVLTAP
jgi:hypothetical protein